MAKIRKIYDEAIKPDGSKQVIYPITSTRAVYTPTNITVDTLLNEGYRFGGVVLPTDSPTFTDQRVFYGASVPGVYPNFGGISVDGGEAIFLMYNGTEWKKGIFGGAGSNNLTGFKSLASISELPLEETTIGYLIEDSTLPEGFSKQVLYVWVGENGDTLDGLYQNCGQLRGASAYESAVRNGYEGTVEEWLNDPVNGIKGNGIKSWTVDQSTADSGESTITVEFDKTPTETFKVKNGKGISSITETPSVANGGTNVIHINLSDGTSYDIDVKNGSASDGFYATATLLNTAIPSPNIGDYAFVSKAGDGTFPAYIYVCTTAGTWTNSEQEFMTEVAQVSVSQNIETGHTDINIGSDSYPVASVEEVSQLGQEVNRAVRLLQNQIYHIEPIVIEGNVINAPNETDISIDDNNLLKFANRAASIDYSGYVYLNKDMTFAEQVTASNTIYEIRYDYDLDGDEVDMPANCLLKFNGGKISNGTLVGDNTGIEADETLIFSDVEISGTWLERSIHDTWFDINGDHTKLYKSLLALLSDDVENTLYIDNDLTIDTANNTYLVRSNTHVILKGSLNAVDGDLIAYQMMLIDNVTNVKVSGSGKIVGDKDSALRTEDGQWGHGIAIRRSNNVVIEGLTISKCYGDGVSVSYDFEDKTIHNNGIIIRNMILDNNWRQGISITDGKEVIVENCNIKNTNGHAPSASVDIEPEADCECENITIRNCIFTENVHGILAGKNTGATRQNSTLRNIVIDNIFYSSTIGFYGIRLYDTDNVSIKNSSFTIGTLGTKPPYGVFMTGDNKNVTILNSRFHVSHASGRGLRITTESTDAVPELINVEGCEFKCVNTSAIKLVVNLKVENCRFDHPFLFDGINNTPSKNISFRNNSIDITGIADSVLQDLVTDSMAASCLYANSLTDAELVGNSFKDGKSDRTNIGSGMALVIYTRCHRVKTRNVLFLNNSLYADALSVNRYTTSGVPYTISVDDTIDMGSVVSVENLVHIGAQTNTKDGHLHISLGTWNATYGFRGNGNALDYDARIMNFQKGTTADLTQYAAYKLMNIAGEIAYSTDDKKMILYNGTSWTNLDGSALNP